jgi:cobalt-zinc-cadmium efflux system outer membrane protein
VWTGLLAVVGNPSLVPGGVTGGLDTDQPQMSEQSALDSILKNSPAVRIAQAGVARAEAALKRARVEPVPDIELKGGLQQNGEALGAGRVGLQGFAEIGVELHIFDRNQGNIETARAEGERARHELERVNLDLRDQTSNLYREYQNAKMIADRYSVEILPRARKAYELMLQRYGLTLASFTSVLNLQRNAVPPRGRLHRRLRKPQDQRGDARRIPFEWRIGHAFRDELPLSNVSAATS